MVSFHLILDLHVRKIGFLPRLSPDPVAVPSNSDGLEVQHNWLNAKSGKPHSLATPSRVSPVGHRLPWVLISVAYMGQLQSS